MKYRKKPVVIEAVQYKGGGNFDNPRIPDWIWEAFENKTLFYQQNGSDALQIKTLEGTMTGSVDDYIIQGVNGEIYPCKPDIFAKTYDKVAEGEHLSTDQFYTPERAAAEELLRRVVLKAWDNVGIDASSLSVQFYFTGLITLGSELDDNSLPDALIYNIMLEVPAPNGNRLITRSVKIQENELAGISHRCCTIIQEILADFIYPPKAQPVPETTVAADGIARINPESHYPD